MLYIASVSIFGEIPHPANKKKKPRHEVRRHFLGKNGTFVATLGGIIFWIRHI